MSEGEEEVDDVVALAEEPAFGCHVEHGAVVGLREDAALWWAGRARGVDEGVRVFRFDGLVAGNKLLLVAAAAAFADLVERDCVGSAAAVLDCDDRLQLRQLIANLGDLRVLLGVFDDDHG